MQYTDTVSSPLGEIILAAEGDQLIGLWFAGQKYDQAGLDVQAEPKSDLPIFQQARTWLAAYFEGKDPGPLPPCAPKGTEFQRLVWGLLAQIPYGQTTTYGQLAVEVARATGKERSSSRAVGGAVGRNPVSIILPCHRVVGASKNLTGFSGGLDRKKALLILEGVDISQFKTPTQGTAL